jgi:lysozyme
MMKRRVNQAGLDLIKSFEGIELRADKCPAGVWTIGWGSTGPHVREGMRISVEDAEALLLNDVARFENCVERICPGLTDNQFAACVSLAFNIGCKDFERSTVARMAKAGNHKRAKLAFGMWVFAGKRRLKGLVRRRAAEAALYGS